VDTVALILASFRYATAEVLGEALPDDVLMRDVGIPLAKQMATLSEDHAEELVRVYRQHNSVVHDQLIREYPGTQDALELLKASGKRMGVVTSKSRPLALRALDRFGLLDYFETVVSCDDVHLHKPDPFPLVHAAGVMGVSTREAIYVGDSPHDMNAALSADCLSVAALWGAFDSEVVLQPRPHYAAESIEAAAHLMTQDE
jgi:pyrophosphatase PpaX